MEGGRYAAANPQTVVAISCDVARRFCERTSGEDPTPPTHTSKEKQNTNTEFTKLIHISGSDIFKTFKSLFLTFLTLLAQERALGPQNSKSAGRNLPGVLSRALEVGIGPIFAPITVADGMGSTVWINLVNPVI